MLSRLTMAARLSDDPAQILLYTSSGDVSHSTDLVNPIDPVDPLDAFGGGRVEDAFQVVIVAAVGSENRIEEGLSLHLLFQDLRFLLYEASNEGVAVGV